MKTAMNIGELVTEVRRQAETRRDFVAASRLVTMTEDAQALTGFNHGAHALNDLAHGQLAEEIGFGRKLYDTLGAAHPDLLAHNVNTLMSRRPAADKRLIRTLDNRVRAVLSNRYRCIDNLGLIEQLLPVLMARPDLSLASADITERRLYIKVVSDELMGEVRAGETFRAGLLIQNSEVGAGAWVIAPFTEVLACTNGATYTALGQRQAHVHRGYEGGEGGDTFELLSDEARQADDRAFFLKARDIIAANLAPAMLTTLGDKLREAAGEKIEGNVAEVVELTAARYNLTDGEREATLQNLITRPGGTDLTRWGIANAITRTAQDAATYDRASELEALGGHLQITAGAVPTSAEAVTRRGRRRKVTAREVAASN
jgi:hypothetical protein